MKCTVPCVKDDWKGQYWGLCYCLSKMRSLLSFPSGMMSHSKIAQFTWEYIGRLKFTPHLTLWQRNQEVFLGSFVFLKFQNQAFLQDPLRDDEQLHSMLPCTAWKNKQTDNIAGPCQDILQAVRHRAVTMEAQVLSQASPCGIYVGQSGNGTVFLHKTSVFHGQYHSTTSPHSLTHSFQYNICNLTDNVITLHT